MHENWDPPLALAGATSLTYWATATPLRPRPKPLIKPQCLAMFDQERCLLFAKTFDLTALEVQIFCKGIYQYCPFLFDKLRPRMRSDRVGAKPVSRLPNVSSSPATISASHFTKINWHRLNSPHRLMGSFPQQHIARSRDTTRGVGM